MPVTQNCGDTRDREKVTTYVHPELRIALKVAAIQERITIPEKLHRILCMEFGREDLLMHNPDPSPPLNHY